MQPAAIAHSPRLGARPAMNVADVPCTSLFVHISQTVRQTGWRAVWHKPSQSLSNRFSPSNFRASFSALGLAASSTESSCISSCNGTICSAARSPWILCRAANEHGRRWRSGRASHNAPLTAPRFPTSYRRELVRERCNPGGQSKSITCDSD